jgi:hypothetical protein
MDRMREAAPNSGRDRRMGKIHQYSSGSGQLRNPASANSVDRYRIFAVTMSLPLPKATLRRRNRKLRIRPRARLASSQTPHFLLGCGPARKGKSHMIPEQPGLTFPCGCFPLAEKVKQL